MNPTLDARDLLDVAPYGGRPVRAGDVVFFLSPGGGPPVVHRVTAVTGAGLITRGDNNPLPDDGILPVENVIGRVVAAVRGDRHRPVRGGVAGRIRGRIAHGFRVMDRLFRPMLHGPYRAASRIGLDRLLPRSVRPRVAMFGTGDGVRYKILVGGRVAGWYDPSRNVWSISRPWRLFVRTVSLPLPPRDGAAARGSE